MENEWLNTKEAAEYIGMSDRSIRSLCAERKIRHRRISERKIDFKKEWLDEYLNNSIIEPKEEETNNE